MTREKLVSRWDPRLYAIALCVVVIGGPTASTIGLTGREIGLMVLGLLSASVSGDRSCVNKEGQLFIIQPEAR